MTRYLFLGALSAMTALAATPAMAQQGAAAFEGPQVGATVGYHNFDGPADGFIIGARVGYDTATAGGLVVGVEGNANLGTGDIDAEYGVNARIGKLVGDRRRTLFFARLGYQEIDFDFGDFFDENDGVDTTAGDIMIGLGADFRADGNAFWRVAVDTVDTDSLRLTAGYTIKF